MALAVNATQGPAHPLPRSVIHSETGVAEGLDQTCNLLETVDGAFTPAEVAVVVKLRTSESKTNGTGNRTTMTIQTEPQRDLELSSL